MGFLLSCDKYHMHAHTNREGSVLSKWVSTERKKKEHHTLPTQPEHQNHKNLQNLHLFFWTVSFLGFVFLLPGQTDQCVYIKIIWNYISFNSLVDSIKGYTSWLCFILLLYYDCTTILAFWYFKYNESWLSILNFPLSVCRVRV